MHYTQSAMPGAPHMRNEHPWTRSRLLQAPGALLVTRAASAAPRPAPGQPGAASDHVQQEPDIFVALLASGEVLAFNGHVDLGTGVRTALGQIVAEELDLPLSAVRVVLGHTGCTPNQGPTIASATIQISAVPLRKAAAQAAGHLRALAAHWLDVAADQVQSDDGVYRSRLRPAHGVSRAQLLEGRHIVLTLDDAVQTKPVEQYRLVGRHAPRVDIPAKASGRLTFVHDMRVPGMLHGRVVRPPYPGRDSGSHVGHSLLSVDRGSIAGIPGIVAVVTIGDFIGIVAEREEHAAQAALRLKAAWRPTPALAPMDDLEAVLRAAPASLRPLAAEGDVDAPLPPGARQLGRSYVWPYQLHGSIGPSCSVADWRDDGLTVWSGTQNPHVLRIDLARLLALDEGRIDIVRMEASGCYGRNCADDASADAALLSRAVGRPVRVQLTRQQEHQWEPKGAAQLMQVTGAIDAAGAPWSYDFLTRYPSNDAPTLALLLTGTMPAAPRMLQMGDRTAVPPYRYPHSRIACDDTPAIVRSAWLRGVSALPNSFAHECFIDELAQLAGADPLQYRLLHLIDTRAADLLRAVGERALWTPHAQGSRGQARQGVLHGRGVAYARYVHSKFPGFGAAWSAWVVDLEVDAATGRITIRRVIVGQDAGMMINPDGVRHQVHGNVVQMLSRVLKEEVSFDAAGVENREWGSYPLLGFTELPVIDVVLMPRQHEPPLGAGESASVPGAAAVANALHDATGVRFYAPPFTADKVRQALQAAVARGSQCLM
jgi:isoquinoline 1-oxidoreductase